MRRFRLTIAAAAVLGACVCASSAAAATHGPIKGIVPARGSQAANNFAPFAATPLIFHGGPVMDTNTVYAIFWDPGAKYPLARNYAGLIVRFFKDVSAATNAGATTNVYHLDTQYGAGITGSSQVTLNSLPNQSTFGGYFVDRTAVSNGCTDVDTSSCVSDSQMSAEISKDISSTGWSNGQPTIAQNHEFFMFTPKGLGSCIISVIECSFSTFCAYHSSVGNMVYANMPFADTVPSACDAGYHPNSAINANADATINVTSHEHNESITDPFGSAWYDSSGNEIGDKCAWMFGTVGSNQANQTINGHPYILQQEFSNYNSNTCLLQGP